jgi:Microcystin-dependent protein
MDTPFVGTIQTFAFGYAPEGYLLCDGSLLPVTTEYFSLFSLIHNEFGGDGVTTFALPNMLGSTQLKVTSGYMCYYIAYQGLYPPQS